MDGLSLSFATRSLVRKITEDPLLPYYDLSIDDWMLAKEFAERRSADARGRKYRDSIPVSEGKIADITGMMGEMVVAKWNGGVYAVTADRLKAPDVVAHAWSCEVRATMYPNGQLLFRHSDMDKPPQRMFMLVLLSHDLAVIVGGISLAQAKECGSPMESAKFPRAVLGVAQRHLLKPYKCLEQSTSSCSK